MERYAAWVTRHAGWVLVGIGGLSLLALAQLVDPASGRLRLGFDPSLTRLLPERDPLVEYDAWARRLFGRRDVILVVLAAEPVFAAEPLRAVARLTERLAALEQVERVQSLANAAALRSVGGELVIEPFLARIPEDDQGLARLEREVATHPLYAGSLVAPGGGAAAIIMHLAELSEAEYAASGLGERIARIVEEERGPHQAWVAGGPLLKVAVRRILLSDLVTVLPLAMLAVAAVALVAFRSLRGVLVPGSTIALAALWTLAGMAAAGHSLNLVTTLVPTLVVTVGFAYAVHVMTEYYGVLRRARERPVDGAGAARDALGHVVLPVLLSGLTTTVGFVSLTLSSLPAVRQFGTFAVLGVCAAVLATLTWTPALLARLPLPARVPDREGRIDRLAAALARFDLRHRRAILIGGAVVAAVAVLLVARVRVGTDVVGNFDPHSPIRIQYDLLERHFEGANSFQVVVQANAPGAFKEPAHLREIRALQDWLESQPEIASTSSLADYVMLLHRAFRDAGSERLSLPDSKRLVSQLLFLGASEELSGFVDASYRTANVTVRASIRETGQVADLLARVEARTAQMPAPLRCTVTGSTVLATRAVNAVSRGQALSLGTAFLGIYAILSLLFTSMRVGLLALLPNALPVLIYFGILGASGISLNATTGLVACMVLGIAVDDSIHFLARFNHQAKRLGDEAEGAVAALRAVARPVTYTTAALCAGLLVLTQSSLRNQVEFGMLAAVTLAAAWLIDLVLTPALTSGMRIVTLWDLLTLDLGDEPQRSMPLFAGLGKRQARIAALMTNIRSFPAGHRLLRRGDTHEELYAVIDGKLAVSVTTPDGVVSLGTLGRGDVVGEVALFHGRRVADVDAITDVRLLEFTQRDLQEQLCRRYPRIGAQFYRNLSAVIAGRLALLSHDQRMRLMHVVCAFAWADQEIRDEERAFIARLAEQLGLDASEQRRVEGWLASRPDPEALDLSDLPREDRTRFVESVAALLLSDGEIAREERELFRPLIT